MNRFVKTAYQPYKWIIAIPMIFFLTMILGILCIIAAVLSRKKDRANTVAVVWAKLCCIMVPLRIKLAGQDNYDPATAYVVVSNHQSMADIPVVHASLGLNIKWVMKKELRRVPIFGAACRHLGCIYIDRSDHSSAVLALEQARKKRTDTASIFFFAEGTRSRDSRLMPFKKGAFKFACDAGLPILPLTIKNSSKRLPSDSLDLTPGSVDLVVHRPIHPFDHPNDTVNTLMLKTRLAVEKGFDITTDSG